MYRQLFETKEPWETTVEQITSNLNHRNLKALGYKRPIDGLYPGDDQRMRKAKKYKAPDFQKMIELQKKVEKNHKILPNGTFVYAHLGKSRKGSFARGFKLTDAR